MIKKKKFHYFNGEEVLLIQRVVIEYFHHVSYENCYFDTLIISDILPINCLWLQ